MMTSTEAKITKEELSAGVCVHSKGICFPKTHEMKVGGPLRV